MKILLTGANGYIGKRLLPALLNEGHQVICCVRDKNRFWLNSDSEENIEILEIDFLKMPPADTLPKEFDAAYYLIHSMSTSIDDFEKYEVKSAQNFKNYMNQTRVQQVIFLGGISNNEQLSKHLKSRKKVGEILKSGKYHTTILRAGIIVGSGSASFEIIRGLVEKLPVMVAPKWILTKSQPIAIRNVITYLKNVIGEEKCYDRSFDICGPQILTYKEMLLQFSEVRHLKRKIITVPVMTPRLSSYWLYFITPSSYKLAVNLVNSMKTEVVCKENSITNIIETNLVPFKKAVQLAYDKIEQNVVISSWKDSLSSGLINQPISTFIEIPQHGCFIDKRSTTIDNERSVIDNIWSIGGDKGWYYANFLWSIRGFLDQMVGGVGLRRGRTQKSELNPGDSVDFWRVILANKTKKRLLLYAEMKLPGEAWLEFKIEKSGSKSSLIQTATFRPKGLFGRLYWYTTMPFHYFIFNGMLKRIAKQ